MLLLLFFVHFFVILLVGFGLICVFVRSKSYRKKINWLEIALKASSTILLSQKLTSYFCWPWASWKLLSETYGTPCHAIGHFVFWCHHVDYRTPCHASGDLVIECYGSERAFFTLRHFFTLHSLLVSRLPWEPAIQSQS